MTHALLKTRSRSDKLSALFTYTSQDLPSEAGFSSLSKAPLSPHKHTHQLFSKALLCARCAPSAEIQQ